MGNARDMASSSACDTLSIHEHTWTALGRRRNSTCKASAKHLPAAKTSGTCKSAHSLSIKTDHVGVTTLKRLDQGHLHPKLEVPCPRPGVEPGPPRWEASTLEKSYWNSLLIAIWHLHMSAWPVENARDSLFFTILVPWLFVTVSSLLFLFLECYS